MIHYLRILVAKLRGLFGGRRAERELEDEIEAHLRLLAERYVRQGMTEEEAAWAARRQFGNLTLLQEEHRETGGFRPIETFLQDVRYGLRILRKNPGFTAAAVLLLALGIGANLTIFSFVDTFFLRPIPAREPAALVNVESTRNGRGYGISFPTYLQYRDHSESFTALAAHYSTAPLNLGVGGDIRTVNGAVVSANYFPMLGIEPRLGRFFLPEEDAVPDRNPVVVISERMWQDRFGGDPAVLGKQLRLNGVDCQIIGVAPANFPGVLAGFPNELWLPTMMLRLGYRWCDAIADANCFTLGYLGRLAPGRTLAEAEAELNLLAGQFATAIPAEKGRVISFQPVLGVRRNERAVYAYQMRLLMTVTGLLLMIACANVASLLLAHAAARRKEIAIRLSIGAGRFRLIRQFLTESLLLALAGGALGLLLSLWAKDLLATFYTTNNGYDLSLSPRAVVYALALTLCTGLLFGLAPALQATRHDLARALKDEGGSQHPRRHRLRSALVIGQVALSLALLVAAGLLVRSESNIHQGANFDPQQVVMFGLRPILLNYSPEKAQAYTREVARRLETTPGVQSVTMATGVSFASFGGGDDRIRAAEQAPQRAEDQLRVFHNEVGPRFFETLKIPLLEGREFNEGDRPGAPRVTIINETLARRLWPQGPALGRTLLLNDQPYQVVGVSLDARLRNALNDPMPFIDLAYWQNNFRPQINARLLIRVAGDPQTMLPSLRRVIVAVDPQVPLGEVTTLSRLMMNAEFKSVMLTSAVVRWAGALALFLSMLGIYGVLAFAVGERRREIGIRMALGAEARDVLRLVIAQGLRLALAGVVVGLLAAYGATRLIKSLLYGVSATDPLTFIVIALSLLVVALLACWIPARRATKVDPLLALRCD